MQFLRAYSRPFARVFACVLFLDLAHSTLNIGVVQPAPTSLFLRQLPTGRSATVAGHTASPLVRNPNGRSIPRSYRLMMGLQRSLQLRSLVYPERGLDWNPCNVGSLVLGELSPSIWSRQTAPFPAGALIIREGDPGDLFYVIADGMVCRAGERRSLDTARANTWGRSRSCATCRTASVMAVTDVRLLSLDRANFLTAVTGSRSSAAVAHTEIDRRLANLPPRDEG